MKHKIRYRGIPAYIDIEARTISGRNWRQNIIVKFLVFKDKTVARLKGVEKPEIPITIDEE